MARKIRGETLVRKGLESSLDLAATLLLWTGIAFAIGFLVTLKLVGVIPALFSVFNAILAFLLFRSLAEIIRLLKKSADRPFSGKISGGQTIEVFKCSSCGVTLVSESRCDACGEQIVD